MPRVWGDVGIDAGGLDVGVTKERRDLLEGSHLVHHGGGSRVEEPVGGETSTPAFAAVVFIDLAKAAGSMGWSFSKLKVKSVWRVTSP